MESLLIVLRALHNLNRWFVLIAAVWALVVLYRGLFSRAAWGPQPLRVSRMFVGLMDLQFLLGLILYVLGPYAGTLFSSFRDAMGQAVLRFFALEHPLQMLIAIIVAHVGLGLAKKATTDRAKYKRAAIAFTIALVIMLAGIPWPGSEHGRPLLPTLAGLFG